MKSLILIFMMLFSTISYSENKLYTVTWENAEDPGYIKDTHVYIKTWTSATGYSDWVYEGSTSRQTSGNTPKYYAWSSYDGFLCFGAQTETYLGISEISKDTACVLSRCH